MSSSKDLEKARTWPQSQRALTAGRSSGSVAMNADELVARLHDAGEVLLRRGNAIGGYFTAVDASDIATQRETKDRIGGRLRAAALRPQLVTVQGRGGEASAVYMIAEMGKMTELIDAFAEKDEAFVPITQVMREVHPEIELPLIAPIQSRRTLRSSMPAILRESDPA
jgi:hypothetical protein